MTEDKRYIILGSFMAIFMDVDGAPFTWLPHRGFIHTPLFLLLFCSGVFGYLRCKGFSNYELVAKICAVTFLSHLILDTIGSSWEVMWLYPFTTTGIALGNHIPSYAMITLKLILFLIPCGIVYREYKQEGKSPLDIYEYLKKEIGTNLTHLLLVLFVFGVATYYLWPVFY